MPHFVLIATTFLNIDTIEAIDDNGTGQGSVLTLRNDRKVRVKEDARDVIKALARAATGELPSLTPVDSSPQIY